MNEIKSIKQSILEIDFDWTSWNGRVPSVGNLTFWRFGISKHHQYSIFRNTFQCHWTRIFETTLHRINGFKLWKIYIHSFRITSIIPLNVNEQESLYFPRSAYSPRLMDCNDGRSIQIISFKFIQYFPLLLIRNQGMHHHLM